MKKLAAILLLFGTLAFAQDKPRHIDFTAAILTLDGKKIPTTDAKDAPALTLGIVSENALFTNLEEDKAASGETKNSIFALSMKIHGQKSLLKKRIGEAYGPLIVGRAYQLLDPPDDSKPAEPKK
jgi:hypothetical protein